MRVTTRLAVLIAMVAGWVNVGSPKSFGQQAPTQTTKPLEVRVVDAETKAPVAGAKVGPRVGGGNYATNLTADDSGVVKVPVARGASYVSILCRKDGYVATSVTWDKGGSALAETPESVTVPLARGKRIGGRVVDKAGKAVAGATLYIEHYWSGDETEYPRVRPYVRETLKSDAEGKWAWENAPEELVGKISFRLEHPDYISGYVASSDAKALLDGSAVITADAGVELKGKVVGPDGKPVAGAKVSTVRDVHVSNDYGKTVQTNAEGEFVLGHLGGERTALTVTAKGMGPEFRSVELKPGMPALAVTLSTGRTVSGRVVNEDGKPVAGADVRVSRWRGGESLSIRGRSDAQGRFRLAGAPADAFSVQVSADGYRYKYDERVGAGDGEAVIRMRPIPTMRGSVTDAATGEPIEKFRVIEGYSLWEGRAPSFSFDRPKEFADGQYELKLDPHDHVVACYVRIEADGREPAVSQAIKGAAGTFDCALKPSGGLSGTLKDADGKPVAGTKVYLVLPGTQVDVYGGEVNRHEGPAATTDGEGRYRFAPQAGEYWLMAMGEKGFVCKRTSAKESKVDLELAAWAAVEGVYRTPLAAKGKGIDLRVQPPLDFYRDPSPMFNWSVSALLGADGRYRAERVPYFGDGPVQLGMWVRAGEDGTDESRWVGATLSPGGVARVDVGAGGVTLKGRVAPRTQADSAGGARATVTLYERPAEPPSKWPADFATASQRVYAIYRVGTAADGGFTIPSVPAGRYSYEIYVQSAEGSPGGGGTIDVAGGTAEQDVGVWSYQKADAMVGDSVPAELGRDAADDKPLAMSRFSGKYLVVASWNDIVGDEDADVVALREAARALKDEPRVARVALNVGPLFGKDGVYVKPRSLGDGWVDAHVSLEQPRLWNLFGVRVGNAGIVSPEGKIVARDVPGRELAERLRGILGK